MTEYLECCSLTNTQRRALWRYFQEIIGVECVEYPEQTVATSRLRLTSTGWGESVIHENAPEFVGSLGSRADSFDKKVIEA